MWEGELEDGLAALRDGDGVTSVEVAEGHDAVTVTAGPAFADHADTDLYRVLAACGFLQLVGPESDWQGSWAVELALVDAETGAEVARGTLPEDEISYSRQDWEGATSARS